MAWCVCGMGRAKGFFLDTLDPFAWDQPYEKRKLFLAISLHPQLPLMPHLLHTLISNSQLRRTQFKISIGPIVSQVLEKARGWEETWIGVRWAVHPCDPEYLPFPVMMSLLFHRAFLWFRKGANQWERGMLDYFGEGLMPGGFTFTRQQVAPATSVSCRSSRTLTHLPASALPLPTEQLWEGSSGPEGLRSFLTVIATDLWVPGNRIFCCFFLVGWGGGCVGFGLWLLLLWMARTVKFKEAHNFKSQQWLPAFHFTLNFWVETGSLSSYGRKIREREDAR